MEVLSVSIIYEKEIKGFQIGKEEVKLLVFVDDMIIYIENPLDSSKNLLDLLSEFGPIVEYKVNIQKLKRFLYIKNKILDPQIRG